MLLLFRNYTFICLLLIHKFLLIYTFYFCSSLLLFFFLFFFFQAEDGIRDVAVTGVQTCALPIYPNDARSSVPHLLGGVRTAFWSSVVGIFWALTLKIRVAMFGDATVPASGADRKSVV